VADELASTLDLVVQLRAFGEFDAVAGGRERLDAAAKRDALTGMTGTGDSLAGSRSVELNRCGGVARARV
jgi:hypothetical protein